MGKLKYTLLVVGTVLGLIFLKNNTGMMFWAELSVPLGMIGYGIGGLMDSRSSRETKP